MIVAGSGSSMFVRNSAATLTIAVFVYPMSENLGWSRTTIVGASSLAGILAILSYGLVVWSMQYLEIAYVSSIREASIIFATLIGFLLLNEKQAKNRLIPSGLIVIGITTLYFEI